MKIILTTLLAIAVIVALWFRLGSTPVQPENALPPPAAVEPIVTTTPVAPATEEASPEPPARSSEPAWPVPPTKPLSSSELLMKSKLEKHIAGEVPTHRIKFDKFRTLTGWIVKETSNQVTFSESYGNTGSMTVNISRKRIVSIDVLTNTAPLITDRDVRFQAEFPYFNFFKRAPYTIVTDEAFFQVERIVRDLQKTYEQFNTRFKPLINLDRSSANDIQVLVFSSQDAFRLYARENFKGTNDIAGIYTINTDRLVVFNQTSATWIQDTIHREEADAIARYGDSPDIRKQLAERRGSRENDLRWFAKLFTRETVRHEGAHQMCYTLGVLKLYPRDMTWLSEGLAIYCETDTIGAINPWRVEELKRHFPSNVYPSIEEVMAASYKPDYLDSYSSYWTLTHFLMESPHRPNFFQFIRTLNNPDTWNAQAALSDMELLCQALATDPATLNKEWRKHLERL